MDFRFSNTTTYNLEDDHIEVKPYEILDKIPQDIYSEVLSWAEDELDFNNITVSISDCNSNKTLIVRKQPTIIIDGLGMCEIELRGALYDINISNHKSVTINTSFIPVLHYSNGLQAMSMMLDRDEDELSDAINNIILPSVRKYFTEVFISESSAQVDMTMTRYFSSEDDIKSFLNEDVHNFITTPFTF